MSPTLLPRVLARVQETRRCRLRLQLWGAISGFALTIAFTIWNWSVFRAELNSGSSFWGFVRLMKTDPDVVSASSREFMFGLLESLPIESLVVGLLFLVLGVSLYAILYALRTQKTTMLGQFSS
jgi:hypothetical protein